MLIDDVTVTLVGGDGGPGVGFNKTEGNTRPTRWKGGPREYFVFANNDESMYLKKICTENPYTGVEI